MRRLQPARSAIACGCLPSSYEARMQSRTPSELRGAIPAGLGHVYGHGQELGKRERFG